MASWCDVCVLYGWWYTWLTSAIHSFIHSYISQEEKPFLFLFRQVHLTFLHLNRKAFCSFLLFALDSSRPILDMSLSLSELQPSIQKEKPLLYTHSVSFGAHKATWDKVNVSDILSPTHWVQMWQNPSKQHRGWTQSAVFSLSLM